MFQLFFSGFLVLATCYGASTRVSPTSTANCYYTFVVPRDEDGKISGSSANEINQLRSEITDLRTSLTNLLQKGVNGVTYGGVNFVNWGRTVCPQNTTIIYKGIGAKTARNYNGGGVNYLCLPENPEWTGNEVAGHQVNSYIHGVEYWADGLEIFPNSHRHNDMPCAVCDVAFVAQSLMIPAKRSCPEGWSMLYEGILMAERTISHHESPSNYICVDRDYEFVTGGAGTEASGYAIPVEIVCGIIPCGPYVQGYELSCVVCAK